jgi:Dolichyl-phosphate-mannose-protein mannosyltransferase
MAIAELPPRSAAPPHRLDQSEGVDVDRAVERLARRGPTIEQLAYLALFALALLAHLYLLGDGALHHDETHHANYSWRVFAGLGFIHDPLLHGPFLYHINALFFFLFGDSNTTARLGPALFGSVLVVLPYLLRRELGRGAALLAAVYLLISPAYMYWSRHIRHDMYQVTFELVAFIAIVRYASTRRPLWLYVGAAALGFMFTNMETFFLYLAIFIPLLALLFFWRVWRPGILVAGVLGLAIIGSVFVLPGKPIGGGGAVQRVSGAYVCPSPANPFPPANPIQAEPGPIFGFVPLATADNDYALCVRNEPDDNFAVYFIKLGQFFLHPAILLGLAVALIGLAGLYALIWRRRDHAGTTAWERARAASDSALDAFASLATGRRSLVALAIFLTIYGLFFTSFLTHPSGIISGTTGSLLYWLAQHNVARGSQPGYYYLILLGLYEPLTLIWGVAGLIMVGVMVGRRLLMASKNRRTAEPQNRRTAEPRNRGTENQEPRTAEPRVNGQPTTDHGPLTTDDAQESPAHPLTRSPAHPLDWSLALPVMLAWWAVATLGLYSWAGEKMPWLTIHVALPLVLLGAWAFAQVLRWWRESASAYVPALHFARLAAADGAGAPDDRPALLAQSGNGHGEPGALAERRSSGPALVIYLAIFGTIALFCFQSIAIFSKPDDPEQWRIPFVLLGCLAFVLLLSVGATALRGARWATGSLALAVTLLVGVYGAHSSYQLSFLWPDVAREKMIFVQTSPDVARVIDRLEQASIRRGGGLDMPIWYDNETVWAWYLRRFTNKQQVAPQLTTPPGPEIQAVLMLQENIDANPQNLQDLTGFRVQRYPLRWWFPNEGNHLPDDWLSAPVADNSPLLMRLLRNPLDGHAQAQLWRYLIYRTPPEPLGTVDFIIAVRPELADEIGLGTGGGDDK